MEIKNIETIEDFTAIIKGLVANGVTFTSYKQDDGNWKIELTGGH
jgi:hypothetical protein